MNQSTRAQAIATVLGVFIEFVETTDTEFVPCCIQNRHDSCPEWAACAETPGATTMSFTKALDLI